MAFDTQPDTDVTLSVHGPSAGLSWLKPDDEAPDASPASLASWAESIEPSLWHQLARHQLLLPLLRQEVISRAVADQRRSVKRM